MHCRLLGTVALALVAASMHAAAHHSHANYDISKWVVIEGTVKQVVLIAPHSIVYLDVKNEQGGTATRHAATASSASGIDRSARSAQGPTSCLSCSASTST
jgi:hypothetical protein